MTEPPSIEALSVFAEAVQDLVTAGLEQSLGRWFACMDSCNQVAEKAMQSVCILRVGHRAPYDHDLVALGESLGAPQEILDDLAILTPYHPETFYAHTSPESADDAIDPETVQDAMKRARAVLRWARSIVVES